MSHTNGNEPELGPIDIVVIGFPADSPGIGDAIPQFLDLVDSGVIHVLDVKGVRREPDGRFSGFDVGDAGADGIPHLVLFEGARTGLISDDDLRVAVEARAHARLRARRHRGSARSTREA
jgi:hypothetical protein